MELKNSLFSYGVLCFLLALVKCAVKPDESAKKTSDLIVDLVDGKWDQIQKGIWLIGFFDKETKESMKLEEDWEVFALKCKEQNINVGQVLAPQNPGLYVRFLVTSFPKVFYIKNGVAHEVKHPSRETLIDIIKDKKWSSLKPVNFLSNPFSIQISLLSHLFVHAVNLYNFEDAIVKEFIPFSSATDIAFGLTFIVVGTILGLLLTCAFGVLQLFMEPKDPEEEQAMADKSVGQPAEESEGEVDEDSNQSKEDDTTTRKRK